MTWVDANNAIYGPEGPFAGLFPNDKDRVAFSKTKESRQVDRLIDSLPEPPAGPQRQEYSGKLTCACPSPSTPPWRARRKPKA